MQNQNKNEKVRIVMDVDPEIKSELAAKAKQCGVSLTLYLVFCGLKKRIRAMPPESIVQAKNLLCEFESHLLYMEYEIEDYFSILPWLDECRELTKQMDALLLEVQK